MIVRRIINFLIYFIAFFTTLLLNGCGNDEYSETSLKVKNDNRVEAKNRSPIAYDVKMINQNGQSVSSGDKLLGSYKYFDLEGDIEEGTKIQWLRNGISIDDETDLQFTLTNLDSGKFISFEVTPKAISGTQDGNSVSSIGLKISSAKFVAGNSAPLARSLYMTTAETSLVFVGSVLLAKYDFDDFDEDAEGLSIYRWFRNGVEIFGESSSEYTVKTNDGGKIIKFEVTPIAITGTTNGNPYQSLGLNIPLSVSGTVTYTSYPLSANRGINYSFPSEKPIRGAVVELQSTDGVLLDKSITTSDGKYGFIAPKNSSLVVVVKAAISDNNLINTKVIDNTSEGALYAMSMNIGVNSRSVINDFNANSGWGGFNYSQPRVAAPFAILDVIYQAQQLVLDADNDVIFPLLLVNWSINNKPTNFSTRFNLPAGDIGSSHYNRNGEIYILGAENLDTDEYDAHVIAHEWGHYFEAKFSQVDSIGGAHIFGDVLDPTVSFGEGFGNAFSGMVLNDPLYKDTGWLSQSRTGVNINIEEDTIEDTLTDTVLGVGSNDILLDGYYSEYSVQEIIYDIFDSGENDDDTLSLGFSPIYDVLVNGQKNTNAFTTIFSFLYHLKKNNPLSSSKIDNLALSENIESSNEFEQLLTPIYTNVPLDGSIVELDVDGFPLQTWASFGEIFPNRTGNKLFNFLYFKYESTVEGCYTIEVIPKNGGDVIIRRKNNLWVDSIRVQAIEKFSVVMTIGEIGVFSVSSFGREETFNLRAYSTPLAC